MRVNVGNLLEEVEWLANDPSSAVVVSANLAVDTFLLIRYDDILARYALLCHVVNSIFSIIVHC